MESSDGLSRWDQNRAQKPEKCASGQPFTLQLMGIETEKLVNVGAFTQGQKSFLEFHRDAILLQVRGRS
jgi:hypothetical protein